MHVSPRTVGFLRALGHDVVRVNEVMPVTSTDEAIVLRARDDERVLPLVERDVAAGAIVTVEDSRIRTRRLPLP
jgi:hypothetical protein